VTVSSRLTPGELAQRASVQIEHELVPLAHDEECRRTDKRQGLRREIKAATPGDDGMHRLGTPRRSHEGGRAPDARTEVADPHLARVRMLLQPVGRADEPVPEQPILKRRCAVRASTTSSSVVRRSIKSVARPAAWSTSAANRLRGLCRLLPLP
jgi:hypothetical protein